jgi:hypothetical protein
MGILGAKKGDAVLWGLTIDSPWFADFIVSFTKHINPQIALQNNIDPLAGYYHIARFIDDGEHIIHAKPPRAEVTKVDKHWLKKECKRARIELWRDDKLTPEQIDGIVKQSFNLLDIDKYGKGIGVKYDYWAIFLCVFGLNKRTLWHCAEIFQSAGEWDNISYMENARAELPSPNGIINSGRLRKIWG